MNPLIPADQVVVIDSDQGQSWILVLARAPGLSGEAQVIVSSQTRQSSRFTWSQNSIASDGSKPSAAIVDGSKNHSQTTSVRSAARGQRVWSIT